MHATQSCGEKKAKDEILEAAKTKVAIHRESPTKDRGREVIFSPAASHHGSIGLGQCAVSG